MRMDWKNPVVIISGLMLVIITVLFEPVIFGGKIFSSPDSLSPKAVGMALNDLSVETDEFPPVSYTHLTLPTILLV